MSIPVALSPESAYRRGTTVSMSLYVVAILAVSLAVRHDSAHGALLIALALLPGLAIVGQIVVTIHYLRHADEYVRSLLGKRLIAASMATLAIFTVWGFLETFAEIPGPPGWSAYCLMWALFGLFTCFIKDSK